MLKAKNSINEKYYISWKNFIEIRSILEVTKNTFLCPYCNESLIFVDGEKVIKHFRHKVESSCEPEPETESHLQMKKFIQEKFNLTNEEIEYTKLLHLGFKPDGFIEEQKIALEVQHSLISEEEFLRRTENYSKNGIYVLWIFDKYSLLGEENISRLLKKAHELYFGRVYFFDALEKCIFPIHFIPCSRYVEEYTNYKTGDSYGGYSTYYKGKRKLKIGDSIKNFNLLTLKNTWKNNNFLIARFYDKCFWKNGDGKNNICKRY